MGVVASAAGGRQHQGKRDWNQEFSSHTASKPCQKLCTVVAAAGQRDETLERFRSGDARGTGPGRPHSRTLPAELSAAVCVSYFSAAATIARASALVLAPGCVGSEENYFGSGGCWIMY